MIVTKGTTWNAIARNHPYQCIQYHSGIERVISAFKKKPPVSREVAVTVLWGNTGVGKSHRARNAYPDAFIVRPGRDPWGMYEEEEVIIFEEWTSEKWSLEDMNMLTDKWRCPLDCRYHNKYALWNKVLILTNEPPTQWYMFQATDTRLQTLKRRINNVFEITSIDQEINLFP